MQDGKVVRTGEEIEENIRRNKQPLIVTENLRFGDRFYAQAFIPEAATIGQFNKFLFMAEGYYNLSHDAMDDDTGEIGIDLVFWLLTGMNAGVFTNLELWREMWL